ncbi:alpha/beta fold hydrolase [Streptomyces mirabilis]|uniref:alpha/beta fold hydrolase n=1 Tax=Streptomyces mirabilis TaxID=68239 RepID=UPI0036A5EE3C
MTAVFVHGVPETCRVWDGVRDRIAADSVALNLPGFGTPRPAGFSATKDAYAQWLSDMLETIEGPIDIVGHDWGALLTLRVASVSNNRLRSWTADLVSCFQHDYVWHERALVWQTPHAGEAWWAAAYDAPPDSAISVMARLEAMGIPPGQAALIAAANDETMISCILDLYRSAVPNLSVDWGRDLPGAARVPGLVVIPTEDPFNDYALSSRTARQVGASVARPQHLRHAWMAQDPHTAAQLLEEFWSTIHTS